MRLNRLWGILVIILVASLVAGVVSSVYEQNTDTIVIEPKSFTEHYSYIIFGEDTDGDGVRDIIYAKNGETGEIEFVGNDFATVMQQAIDALPDSGGKILIKAGQYMVTKTIRIAKSFIVIEGEGTWDQLTMTERNVTSWTYTGTILRSKEDGLVLFDIGWHNDTAMRVVMERLTFTSHDMSSYQPNTTAIKLDGKVRQSLFRMLWFCRLGVGIYQEPNGFWLQDVYFQLIVAEDMNRLFHFALGYNLNFYDLYAGWQHTDDYLIRLEGKFNEIFIDNLWLLGHAEEDSYRGLYINYAERVTISNVISHNAYYEEIIHVVAEKLAITNVALENSNSTTGSIVIDARYATLNNIIIGADAASGYVPNYGIYLKGQKYPNGIVHISNVVVEDCRTAWIYNPGGYTVRTENINVKGTPSENSGIAVNLYNGAYIPHGLFDTPTLVVLTPLNATYDGVPVIVSWNKELTNSTHIVVNVYWANGTAITDPVIAVSWYAKVGQ